MTISFRLDFNSENSDGFPLVLKITHKGIQRRKIIGYSKKNHFDLDAEMINTKHPDYEILAPKILNFKLKARKMIYKNYNDADKFLQDLLAADIETITFNEAATEIIGEMEKLAAQFGIIKDLKGQNRLKGNIKVYQNVKAQFENFSSDVLLVNLDYNLLLRFKNYQLGIGNSKNTVHNYLRTIRAIYKKAAMKYKIPAANPFEGVFAGLSQKSYNSKKKNITKEDILKLELAVVSPAQRKYLDMWLLQFYFGGCDLIDVYYLYKKSLRRGRVYFERSKTDSGLPIDLKVHPKAKAILDRYENTTDEWLFPFDKKKEIYESFRSAYAKALKQIQKQLEIEVLPGGGFIGVKVARHTFATIGKNLLIHEDILRELMGHERNEVDNFYKDRFSEAVRDQALFKIIE